MQNKNNKYIYRSGVELTIIRQFEEIPPVSVLHTIAV